MPKKKINKKEAALLMLIGLSEMIIKGFLINLLISKSCLGFPKMMILVPILMMSVIWTIGLGLFLFGLVILIRRLRE